MLRVYVRLSQHADGTHVQSALEDRVLHEDVAARALDKTATDQHAAALVEACFPDGLDEILTAVAGARTSRDNDSDWVEFVFESQAHELLALPFETMSIFEEVERQCDVRVGLHRRVAADVAPRSPARPGPVRILAALRATSPEGERAGKLIALRGESPETRAIHALESSQLHEIREAIRYHDFDVLHLACTLRTDGFEIEGEDGRMTKTTAKQLAAASAGVALLVLETTNEDPVEGAQCARQLLEAGVPYVLVQLGRLDAGQDARAFATFYEALRSSAAAIPSLALATLRRATTVADQSLRFMLFAGTELTALVDHSRPQQALAIPSPARVAGLHGAPRAAEAIGRRAIVARIVEALRAGPPKPGQGDGQSDGRLGVAIRGSGGIGKRSVARSVLSSLRAEGFAISTFTDAWGLDAGEQRGEAGEILVVDRTASDDAHANAQTLTEAIAALEDREGARVLALGEDPLPESLAQRVLTIELGTLTVDAALRLAMRLPNLALCASEALRKLFRRIGGHPRLFELADAVAGGVQVGADADSGSADALEPVFARIESVRRALNLEAHKACEELSAEEQRGFHAGVRDVLVHELVRQAREAGREELLCMLTALARPVSREELDALIEAASATDVEIGLAQLDRLALLEQGAAGSFGIEAWTRPALRRAFAPQQLRAASRRAATHFEARSASCTKPRERIDLARAGIRCALDADGNELALALGERVMTTLEEENRLAPLATFASELASRLPLQEAVLDSIRLREARARCALGEADEALAICRDVERRVLAGLEKAHALRELATTWQELAGYLAGNEARAAAKRNVAIRRRLLDHDDDRARDEQDLAIALVVLGELTGKKGPIAEAGAILMRLRDRNALDDGVRGIADQFSAMRDEDHDRSDDDADED